MKIQYDAEVDATLTGLSSIIEPVLIIFLGGVVIFIALAAPWAAPLVAASWVACVESTLPGLGGVDVGGDHDGVVVPHGPVHVHNRGTSIGIVDHRSQLIEQLVGLVAVVQQIVELPQTVLVLHEQGRI